LTEILKQNQYAPLPVEKQVLIIFAGTNGYMDDIQVGDCKRFEQELYQYMDSSQSGVLARLADKKAIDDTLKADMIAAIQEFKKRFAATAKVS
jgi:F-type H+-transporting ATPase subunit alpha